MTLTEHGRDLGKHAGHVIHGQAQIVMGDGVLHRLAFAIEAVRHETTVARAMNDDGGGLAEIADDTAASRVLTGAAPVKQGLADDVAIHQHGVVAAADTGQHMTQRDQRRLRAYFHQTLFIGTDHG